MRVLEQCHLNVSLRWQTPAHGPHWLQTLFPWTESTGNTVFHPKPKPNSIVKQQRPLKKRNQTKVTTVTAHSAVSCARSPSQMQHSPLRSSVWRDFGSSMQLDTFEKALFTRGCIRAWELGPLRVKVIRVSQWDI